MIQSRLTYTLCMLIATLVAGWLLRRSQRDLGLTRSQRIAILVGGLVGASFAAKLPFLLFARHDSLAAAWLGDGKTILWGLAGGYAGVELGKWATFARVRTGDTFVVAVAVAVAIGRLGCLLYGCCYGIPTTLPWGLSFPAVGDGDVARHPTQLYEMFFHLGFACVAAYGTSRSWFRGNWMPVYVVAYAAYRFASEWLRPEPEIWWGLTFYQISSIVIAVTFISIALLRRAEGA